MEAVFERFGKSSVEEREVLLRDVVPKMEPRFGKSSVEEREVLLSDVVPKNTKVATQTWIKALKLYKAELDLRTCSKEELAATLEGFYVDARKQDGGMYKRASYLSARGAIQRELQCLERDINIFTDKTFAKANALLNGVLKGKKKAGEEEQVEHKNPIDDKDWTKIMAYFEDVKTTSNPVKLTR